MGEGEKNHGLNHLSQESGFSLVEVLMALVILVFGILGYLKSSATIMGTNIQSTKESKSSY